MKFVLAPALALFLFSAVFPAEAAPSKTAKVPAPVEIAGWIPYWRKDAGASDALAHLGAFHEISPFGYTVRQDGTLFDAMKIDEAPWLALIEAARAKKIKIFPTVMWANPDAIDRVLRNPALRKAHIKEIVDVVNARGFDGVDIDYENKHAKTKPYFSLFLRDLYKAMGKKFVSCTIEPRTPLDSRFDTIPKGIKYANDFSAINKYCDRVRIMTYDQGTVDLKLNRAAEGLYVPVADPKWVEKVVKNVSQAISKKKIFIGVPTYGYEFQVTPAAGKFQYKLLWSFNPKYALDIASKLNAVPERNIAGEMSLPYFSSSLPDAAVPANGATDTLASNNPDIATTTVVETSAAARASTAPFRILWWSDASAIQDKIRVARKTGVRGIAIFKIDGGSDPSLWDALLAAK